MHIPVLKKEVIEYLGVRPNRNYVDCTFGEGGHSAAILERSRPYGKVLGIEYDLELIAGAKLKISGRLVLVNDSYVNLERIVGAYNFYPVNGVLFDFGVSMWHFKQSGRGFSFLYNEALDMRYNKKSKINDELTAERIVNNFPEEEIEKILREYGEERFARKIAEKIIKERKQRPINTTYELVEIIKNATPGWYHHRRTHFATKTFQALRIAVNSELENIKLALPQALEILNPGGRIAAISFHSLEDRIVKQTFLSWQKPSQTWQKRGLGVILTKKPVSPSAEEIADNPASRSSKLRAFEKQ